MMSSGIIALGTATPPYYRTQLDAGELICKGLDLNPAQKRVLRAIHKSSGIEGRYSVLKDYSLSPEEFEFFPRDPQGVFPSTAARMTVYKENALPLALAAIENCFQSLKNFDKKTITHVITVSCTGMYAPGLDIEIVKSLALTPQTKRTCVNFMGCYGAFNALKMADDICKADMQACVLIISVELCSIHFQKEMTIDTMISNTIFADGAAAVLVQVPKATQKHFKLENFYCDLIPDTENQMAWHIGNEGFDILLSAYVPRTIEEGIAQFVTRLLASHDLTREYIDFYAIHPGGVKILEACETALELTKEDNHYAYQTLKKYGNMSSATILFMLKMMWEDLDFAAHHAKKIWGCAFGPGLTLESLFLDIQNAQQPEASDLDLATQTATHDTCLSFTQ